MPQKLLTQLELKVMNLLWDLQHAFVKDLIAQWPDAPAPAYNTVSTVVRILEEKDYAGHESFGRSHRYFAKVSRGQYQARLLRNVLDNAFSGSVTSLISTLVDGEDISEQEKADLIKLIDEAP